MSEARSIWSSMVDVSEKMHLEKAKPNKILVEEALSFDASKLDTIEEHTLRKYLVVLGQYLITLQYEENKSEAVCSSWGKALDSYIYRIIQGTSKVPVGIKTLSEKRAWVIENDEQAFKLNEEYQLADATRSIISNMHKPVEQYINTLKKEIDARENEKKRS
jgi:DNA-directed RNA polymerase beta' subunit